MDPDVFHLRHHKAEGEWSALIVTSASCFPPRLKSISDSTFVSIAFNQLIRTWKQLHFATKNSKHTGDFDQYCVGVAAFVSYFKLDLTVP